MRVESSSCFPGELVSFVRPRELVRPRTRDMFSFNGKTYFSSLVAIMRITI